MCASAKTKLWQLVFFPTLCSKVYIWLNNSLEYTNTSTYDMLTFPIVLLWCPRNQLKSINDLLQHYLPLFMILLNSLQFQIEFFLQVTFIVKWDFVTLQFTISFFYVLTINWAQVDAGTKIYAHSSEAISLLFTRLQSSSNIKKTTHLHEHVHFMVLNHRMDS